MTTCIDAVRVGVIGLGVISKYYIEALRQSQGAKIVAICDIDAERMRKFDYLKCKGVSRYADIIEDRDVDAVIVTLPNNLHYQVCRDALSAGKHVCCEKPLVIQRDQAEELYRIARREGVTLFTAFHRRFNKHVIEARSRSDAWGRIQEVRARYWEKIEEHCGDDRWYLDAVRSGGGCIADNGPNVFDTLIELFGPLEIASASANFDASGIDTYADLLLHTQQGTPIRVSLDWQYADGEEKVVEIEFADGAIDRIDMLAGCSEFKASLWHEYDGIISAFAHACRGVKATERGGTIVDMVAESYRRARQS